VLFSHALVMDVVAGTYLPDRFVLVREGRIAEIFGVRMASSGTEHDLKGRVPMPGQCDGHVHVTAIGADFATLTRTPPSYIAARAAPIPHGMLMRGFTTVRGAGGLRDDLFRTQPGEQRFERCPGVLIREKSQLPTATHIGDTLDGTA
jgi:imidazolonepropionase-like amidohydrolase